MKLPTLKPSRFFYGILAGLALSLSLIAPALAQPRPRQECLDAAGNEMPLNICKYTKDSQEADFTQLGDSIYPLKTSDTPAGPGGYLHQGVVPIMASGIAYMALRPPVQSGEYIADLLQNSELVPQAYAQGLGFSSLSPLLTVWKMFRNVAYFLFTGVFLIVGFMIMFRAKIDPQTVISIQSAFPKLVITLIIITFSYAIAGFMVDLIYLITFVVISLFEVNGIINDSPLTLNAIFGLSIFRIGTKYFIGAGEVAGTSANAVSAVIQGIVGLPGGIFDWIIDSLAYLIIAVMILIALFRTFFALLMAYIGIILAVIFAPVQLLMNAFPGSNTFASWIRGLAANAAVFPAIAVMIILGAYLVGGESVATLGISPLNTRSGMGYGDSEGFVPPFITSKGLNWGTNAADEEFGVAQIRAIIGLGFIMLLPEVAKVVKTAMQVKDSGTTSAAFGSAGSAAGMVFAPVKSVFAQRKEHKLEEKKADAIGQAVKRYA